MSARLRMAAASDHGAHAASILAGLLLWQLLAGGVERIPGPAEVVSVLADELANGSLLDALAFTLARFSTGLAIAFVIGVGLGILLGLSPAARAFLNDIVIVGLAVPGVIWALLAILWFGFSFRTPVVAVALTAAPFIAINVAQGVRATSRELLRMSGAFGVPLARRIRHLVLPSVMDYVLAGLRFGVIMGWNAVLFAEWFGGTQGVGHRTRTWYDANQFDGFVAWIVFFIAVIVVLDRLVLERLARRTFRWRGEATVALRGGA